MRNGVAPVERAAPDRTWLVALAAVLWGTDALIRTPLSGQLPAATVVFWEHLIIVAMLSPWLLSAWRAWRVATARERLSLLGVGAGASAVATALFTEALRVGDPVTPLVLQKLQPLVAMAAAALLLGERLRRGYWAYAVPALVGAWLMSFAQPFDVRLRAASAALLAVGAAVLWALGTVLGRLVSASMASQDVTVLRFVIGLPASAIVLGVQGAPVAVGGGQLAALVVLGLVPGLLGLVLYYLGLRTTAASRATLAELAFPLTATIIGVTLLGGSLTASQWLGVVIVAGSVTGLSLHERTRPPLVNVARAG